MLKVMLVDDQPERAASVRSALESSGCKVLSTLNSPVELYERVKDCAPDVIIIDTESPSRDVLEHIAFISRDQPRPIVMFSGDRDEATIRSAIRAGVTAYVVDGLAAERVRPVMQVAVERFEAEQALKRELANAKNELTQRIVVERAKGIIMKQKGISEEDAFRTLRKFAMDRAIKMADAAEQIIQISQMLG